MGVMLILLGASLALQTWSAGAKARARKITLVQTALALPAQQELTSLKEEVGANLARVRAGNGWCFNDEELIDLQCQKERFVGLIDYLKPREQAHLILSVEVAPGNTRALKQCTQDKISHLNFCTVFVPLR